MRSHDLSNNLRPSPSNLCKSAHNFTWTPQGSCTAVELQNLKISGPETQPHTSWSSAKRCLNETRASSVITCSRADASFPRATRFYALYPNPCLSCMTSWMTLADLVWPTWKSDLDPNRLKKKREKILWPNGPLTLIKKSKFSKGACPTQFFAYIPILEFISLFKTRKLCKLSKFQKVDFWTNLDQKVKIFKDLFCLIFREDSDFGVYFFIWEYEIAQIVWFYNCWL